MVRWERMKPTLPLEASVGAFDSEKGEAFNGRQPVTSREVEQKEVEGTTPGFHRSW